MTNSTMTKPIVGQFCWNELATSDVNKAKDFYGKVFGWQFKDIQMDQMTYTLVKTQDKEFAGIWHIPPEQQAQIPAHWMSYILVADVAKAAENAKQNGAEIIKGPMQAGDMGRFVILKDPLGAYVALWEPLNQK